MRYYKYIAQAMEVRSIATEEDKTKIVFWLPYIGQKGKYESGKERSGIRYFKFHAQTQSSDTKR